MPRVIPISCTQVEVHVFRRRGKRLELLLLRRASQRSLAGVWQPVTGGIERDETVLRAAAREVLEETGLTPLRWWALEHLAAFYDPGQDVIRIVPVFAAEVAWTDRVDLSAEHDRYAFVSLAQASRRVLWKTQRQAIQAIRDEVFSGVASGAAREVTERFAAAGTRKPATRVPRTRRATPRETIPAPRSRHASSRSTRRAAPRPTRRPASRRRSATS